FCVKIVRLYSYSHRCIDHLTPHYNYYKKEKPLPPLSAARKLELTAGGFLTLEDLRTNVEFVG
ncbi:hypothetical protein Tco_0897900, partial [Tanacetum coccineum]